jgi:hypothetical protein
MVSLEPIKKLTTKPPIMADTNPMIGGNSDALAIPKLSGKASKNTMKPETASVEKFSFRPAKPSNGIFSFLFSVFI